MAEQLRLPHKLTLTNRSNLNVSGVTEVVSFDEETVVLHTELGTLVIQGRDLQLKTLTAEGVAVDGTVSALTYEEPKQEKGGWMHRLLR